MKSFQTLWSQMIKKLRENGVQVLVGSIMLLVLEEHLPGGVLTYLLLMIHIPNKI